METSFMPPQAASHLIWQEKYRRGPEDGLSALEQEAADTQERVSAALSAADQDDTWAAFNEFVFDGVIPPEVKSWTDTYRWAHANGMILAGRPNSALGTAIEATLINCFVQPIEDTSIGEINGRPGIMPALAEAFETLRRGGGVGYNFSNLRPRGALVESTNSTSSGPISYMEVFGQSCKTVESAGQRRGAQMAVLDCTHPDVEEFIACKADLYTEEGQQQPLAAFNISVNVFDSLIASAEAGESWELYHKARPHPEYHPNAYRRDDGMWVYKTVDAQELLDSIVRAVYDGHGEPGVFFGDRVNDANPLNYREHIRATNPCAEQVLPDYGCCDLGQVNLAALVRDPFTEDAVFDYTTLVRVVRILQRALDNVLDLTLWPLKQQQQEAMDKRRVGVGFLGLGSALAMLGLRYDSDEGRAVATKIARTMAITCYEASIELARERGSFPLLDAKRHVEAPFIKRLPKRIRDGIAEVGLRNSHSLSIAPTGTIAMAFADNASNGIEPPFAWFYQRRVLDERGQPRTILFEDHAFRLWRHLGCPGASAEEVEGAVQDGDHAAIERLLPDSFRKAEDIAVIDHLQMMAAVQPYIDSSISKTVNVAVECGFDEFRDIYTTAHKLGLKSVAAFRPQPDGAAVLIANKPKADDDSPPESDDPDRLVDLPRPEGLQETIVFPGRPQSPEGHEGRTWDIRGASSRVLLTCNSRDGVPFEVLVSGGEAPRGANVLAKLLSLDMHTTDAGWVMNKLRSLSKVNGGDPIKVRTLDGERSAPSALAAIGVVVFDHYRRLGLEPALESGPVLDARICKREPKTADGGAARAFDVVNPATGDDFTMFVKEVEIEGFGRWPLSVWFAGHYPRSWDGIAKILSLDMQIADPAWIARKIRAMENVAEEGGDFMARVPGAGRSRNWPSTWAYLSALLRYRYQTLGWLDESAYPVGDRGSSPEHAQRGMPCPSCGNNSLVKRDGCETCNECGHIGACG